MKVPALTFCAVFLSISWIPWMPLEAQEDRAAIEKALKEATESLSANVAKLLELEKSLEAELANQRAEVAELRRLIEEREATIAGLRAAPAPGAGLAAAASTAFLGVTHIEPTATVQRELELDAGAGAQVVTVVADSPASRAGLREGDVIVSLAGSPVTSSGLAEKVHSLQPGKTVPAVVVRDGEKVELEVALTSVEEYQLALKERTVPKVVLGVVVEEKDDRLEVFNVEEALTGAVAKLEVGDVLQAVNGQPVRTIDELRAALAQVYAGDQLVLQAQRGEETFASRVVAAHDKGKAQLVASGDPSTIKVEPAPTVARAAERPAEPVAVEKPKEPAADEKKPADPEKPEKPAAADRRPAFLGVKVEQGDGTVRVIGVEPDSTASAYGLAEGDILVSIDATEVRTIGDIRSALEGKLAGDTIAIVLRRDGEPVEVPAARLSAKGEAVAAPDEKPADPEKPEEPAVAREKGYLGIRAQEIDDGVQVEEVVAEGPAAKAELQVGDRIVRIGEVEIKTFEDMVRALDSAFAGDTIAMVVRRGDEERTLEVTLGKKESD